MKVILPSCQLDFQPIPRLLKEKGFNLIQPVDEYKNRNNSNLAFVQEEVLPEQDWELICRKFYCFAEVP